MTKSDGCTGFQWLERFFDIRPCCVIHDHSGSDGELLDCLRERLPGWAYAPAAFSVAWMVLFRPVYSKIKSYFALIKEPPA